MSEAAPLPAGDLELTRVLLEVRFCARVDRIKLIRRVVEASALMCDLASEHARDVVLAVDEACQNIIVHGYKSQGGGEIVLTLASLDDGLLVELRDQAPRIDPARIQHRALHDVKPGKLGCYFMSAIMDRVEYLPDPGGGNLLRMYKRKDGSS